MSYDDDDEVTRFDEPESKPERLGKPKEFEVLLKNGDRLIVFAHFHFANGPTHETAPMHHVFRVFPGNVKKQGKSRVTLFNMDSVVYVRELPPKKETD